MRLIERIIEGLLVALLVGLTIIVNVAVVARYVFGSPVIWSLEVSRILFLWIVFLGAALAVRRNEVMAINLVSRHLSERWSRRAVPAAVAVFAIVFAVLAVGHLERSARQRYVLSGLPVAISHAGAVVCGVLVCVFSVEAAFREGGRRAVEPRHVGPASSEAGKRLVEGGEPPQVGPVHAGGGPGVAQTGNSRR